MLRMFLDAALAAVATAAAGLVWGAGLRCLTRGTPVLADPWAAAALAAGSFVVWMRLHRLALYRSAAGVLDDEEFREAVEHRLARMSWLEAACTSAPAMLGTLLGG